MNEHPVDRAQELWLAQPTEAFRLGAGDLAKTVRRLESDARNARAQLYVVAFFNVMTWGAMFFAVPMWGPRVGVLLSLLGWTYVIQQVTSHSRRTIERCLDMAEVPVTSFIRQALERERAFQSDARFWYRWLSIVVGPVVFGLSAALSERDALVPGLLIAVGWIALTALQIPSRRTKINHVQKQLDELQLHERAPQ
jgi:hypothetical protein